MTIDPRILIAAAASLAGHLALREVLDELPARSPAPPRPRVTVRVVEAPPPPPPPPRLPEPPPPPAPPKVATPSKPDAPRPRPPKVAASSAPVSDAPPTTTPSTTTTVAPGPTQAVFGVTMESTNSGSGPAVKTGNAMTATRDAPDAKPSGGASGGATEPVPASEVTKMPLPRGRCAGRYTDEAREAAIEGVVILQLVVSAEGKPRNVKVVSGLSHGLTEAAVAALEACTFDPGERNGVAVAVRVREFKIRFVLDE